MSYPARAEGLVNRIRFIDGFKNFFFNVWHVKVIENGSQNWSHRDSILLDVYISMEIVKWYVVQSKSILRKVLELILSGESIGWRSVL